MEKFRKSFDVLWADLDPNFHVRHTAYNDYAAQVRFAFLSENGYTLEKFRQEGIGPVIFREETKFLKEVFAGDTLTVDMQVPFVSEDGRKWKIQHHVFRKDGECAAEITIEGAWFDLKNRKVTVPPQTLQQAMAKLQE
ncbi:MAG: thioesterase family protein [Bdellovibrionaceae bacterium]|nr:thioesterase family protein [Pseudobdellovibrionaceae bacterium]